MSKERFHRDLIVQWYDQYSAPVFKYILKMIKDVQRAEDLTQDTFIKAYKYMSGETTVKYPKTFLYRIAHNLTIDYLRKQAPINIMEDFLSRKKDPGPSIEKIVEIREGARELYEALSLLKTSYRQVIILRKIEDFSVQETAHILNWSESKVKSTLFRALRNLEKLLIKGGFINETS
ncbi:RNA polymerase sigma factor [Lentibacillus sp. CBA3610]|uniref:RNA polymerase sigma factor n=1 Tax=Lentibacillus sp. CBA3610 TaxID=2518176 RepID=UPI001595264A|nr:RNA polymerase sigma factor [Lentibacillus sp. CBA3610]QKY71042.1 RNA polymerase sigma factor [Lentibacillus sp. CBA3610]